MKQPRVPEYRASEGTEAYIRRLILFLKDFCQEAWTQSRAQDKAIDGAQQGIDGIRYPVTSVNAKTGDVELGKDDVGALGAQDTAKDSERIDGRTWTQILDALFPVGYIYMSAEETSPAARFGGTWERIEDRFLLAAGNAYEAGATGGETEHTLTAGESGVGAHVHKINGGSAGTSTLRSGYATFTATSSSAYAPWFGSGYSSLDNVRAVSVSTDASEAHNNMPPYLAVYMWKRVE